VLEDEGRAEFGFAVSEDTLNAGVLNPLQHTEFPQRGASHAVTSLWRRGARVGVDADAPADAGSRMPGGEVLPVVTLSEHCPGVRSRRPDGPALVPEFRLARSHAPTRGLLLARAYCGVQGRARRYA
jgi:hypothetical protein